MATKKKTSRPKKPSGVLAYLSDDEFAHLAKRLVEREQDRCGIPLTEGRTTVANNYPDGGIDYLVPVAPKSPSDWLGGPTVFQFKRSMPSLKTIQNEITGASRKTKETSKLLRKNLNAGSDYRLVVGSDVAPAVAEEFEEELRKFLRGKRFRGKAMVLGLDGLQRWLRSHLTLIGSVPDVPAFAKQQLRTWEVWRDAPELALRTTEFPWVPDSARTRQAPELMSIAAELGVVRVEGAAGVGKSRFVFEALRSVESSVCYLSECPADLQALFSHSPGALWGWLVIDECDAEDHERIRGLARPPGLKVVTIGATDAPGTDPSQSVIRLEPLPAEDFKTLAENLVSPGIPPETRAQLARRCSGYPKLLRLALEAVTRDPSSSVVSEGAVTKALTSLLANGDNDVARAIQLLSLPVSFDEADRACLVRAEQLPVAKMEKALTELRKRALLGGYRALDSRRTSREYVTPRLFAEWMALDLWSADPFAVLARIGAAEPPPGLMPKIFRQLLGGPGFSGVQKVLISDSARLQKLIDPKGLVAIADELSYRFPADAFDFVRRLLPDRPVAEVSEFRNSIRTIAWFGETFGPAVQLLAEFEPPDRFIAELFGTVLGATQADGAQRLEIVRDWASSTNPSRRRLALACAVEAARSEAGRSIDPRLQFDRRWRPRTHEEEFDYRSAAVSVVVGLLNDVELGEAARQVGPQLIDGLIREGFLTLARKLARELSVAGVSKEMLRSIFLRFRKAEGGLLTDRELAELEEELREFAPADLRERVEEVAGRYEPLEAEELRLLTKDLVENHSEEALAPLFVDGAFAAFQVGEELGRSDRERSLLKHLLKLARARRNNRLVCGYLSTITGSPAVDELLDSWAAEASLVRLVFDATRMLAPSSRGLVRLKALFEEDRIDRAWVNELKFGGYLLRVSASDALEFLNSGLFEPVAVHGLLFQRAKFAPDDKVRAALFEAWSRFPLHALRGHDAWEWQQTARMFEEERRDEVADRISEALSHFEAALAIRDEVRQFELMTQKAIIVRLFERDPLLNLALIGVLRVDELTVWALEWSRGNVERQIFLGGLVGNVFPGSLADELLNANPKNSVLEALIASRLASGGGWGPESALHEAFVHRADRLVAGAKPPLQKLAKRVLKNLKIDLDDARARERYEHESGELLMFGEGASRYSR